YCSVAHRILSSFPTRRSSDLIDAIGKRDVDDPIQPAERHRWLRAIPRQRPQSFALSSSQEYPNGILHVGHSRPPQRTAMARHILDRKSTRLNSSHVAISYAVS